MCEIRRLGYGLLGLANHVAVQVVCSFGETYHIFYHEDKYIDSSKSSINVVFLFQLNARIVVP
jgi:hypothetical protein